jgi:MFS family permease
VYYVLNFLQGARKQLFLMFAVWLMVKGHGTSREVILGLMIVNQILSLLTAPTMGRLVDRFGERATLMASHGALVLVMGGYAFITSTYWLYALYVADSLLFVGSIALTTYLNKTAPREEIRPTITMGVTMNHIPSVLVPLLGGLAWEAFGSKAVFLTGAGLAFAALMATLWVRPETQAPTGSLATEPAD